MVELPVAEAIRLQGNLRDGEFILGNWHSHPPGSNCKPSEMDVKAWSYQMQSLDRELYVGLIVSEIRDDVGLPELRTAGYVMRFEQVGDRRHRRHREVEITTWRY